MGSQGEGYGKVHLKKNWNHASNSMGYNYSNILFNEQ